MNAVERYDQPVQPTTFQICADEHLDYRSIHTFKNLCTDKSDTPVQIIIDLQKTRYIDSSGIALLHCLQHWVSAPCVTVRLINCSPEIRPLLSHSRFAHHIQVD